jgi:hypothetical protein
VQRIDNPAHVVRRHVFQPRGFRLLLLVQFSNRTE